jgi:hypothetical protein
MVDRDHSQKEEKVMTYAAEIVAKRLVEIHAAKAVLEEQYEAVKKELLALGVDEVSLDVATVKVTDGIRFTLDNKAVIEELGQSWVDDHTKLTAFKQVRVTYKAVARKVA